MSEEHEGTYGPESTMVRHVALSAATRLERFAVDALRDELQRIEAGDVEGARAMLEELLSFVAASQ